MVSLPYTTTPVPVPAGGKEAVPEVYYNNAWHPICKHWFWNNDAGATLVCNKLGFKYGTQRGTGGSYGKTSMRVGNCDNKQDLMSCQFGVTQGVLSGKQWGVVGPNPGVGSADESKQCGADDKAIIAVSCSHAPTTTPPATTATSTTTTTTACTLPNPGAECWSNPNYKCKTNAQDNTPCTNCGGDDWFCCKQSEQGNDVIKGTACAGAKFYSTKSDGHTCAHKPRTDGGDRFHKNPPDTTCKSASLLDVDNECDCERAAVMFGLEYTRAAWMANRYYGCSQRSNGEVMFNSKRKPTDSPTNDSPI